ncbi:hypothetical protein ACW9HJ_22865 [Nocardia gipuzkoensis]
MTRDQYSFDSHDDYPPTDRRTMQQVKREQAQREAAARDQQAAAATSEIGWRVNELETVLRSSLDRDPRLEFDALRQRFVPSPPRLGALAAPPVAPDWSEADLLVGDLGQAAVAATELGDRAVDRRGVGEVGVGVGDPRSRQVLLARR